MEIKKLLEKAIYYLNDSEYTNPHYEARLILSELLDKDLSYIISHEDENLSENITNKYLDILKKRSDGWPLAYILGETEFYGNKFYVDEGVLIPRRDTEISVETISKIISKNKIKNILEIGSGTGIVSISLAKENEDIEFDCIDISDKAISNTKKNIKFHNLSNVRVFKSDIYSNVCKKYDLIYSNPPYIKREEISKLQKEISYEPITALDGGVDGLIFYRRIIKDLDEYLSNKGFLVLEIGYNQKEDIYQLLSNYNHSCIKDLSSLDRVIIASKGEIDV